MNAEVQAELETLIDRWREHVLSHGGAEATVAILEHELRDGAVTLRGPGLSDEEAFAVALRRMARKDALTRGFAHEYSEELWVAPASGKPQAAALQGKRAHGHMIVLGCAVAAALAIKVPVLFGYELGGDGAGFYARNASLFVLPFLAAYFIWKLEPGRKVVAGLTAIFTAGAVVVNAYPLAPGGSTEALAAIHLPIVLWLAVGIAYVRGEWLSDARRMEYVRFTGEWVITYALIALGGGVLVMLTTGVFEAIGLDVSALISEWVLPCGAAGAVIVAAWLVETRHRLVGGMAPLLAGVFTPLFTVMLAALLVGVLWTRGVVDIEREVLILFDLLLVVVLALVLYTVSAPSPVARPGLFDWLLLMLIGCALAVDVFTLMNIAGRLSEYGLSANRTAAVGLNLILLANLTWSAVLEVRLLKRRGEREAVERWQVRYLPVYALWATIVVVAFPVLFGFA